MLTCSTRDGAAVADELGSAAAYRHLDVSSAADWAAAVEDATARFGGVDILVNNAAIHHVQPLEFETQETFERFLRINLVGAFLGIQAVLPAMRARGGGSIVNISSTAGMKGYPGHGAYGASKWGLRGLSKVAAVELGADHIRVNSVHPGPIRTGMMPQDEASMERFRGHPLGRHGEPEEVSRARALPGLGRRLVHHRHRARDRRRLDHLSPLRSGWPPR